MAPKKPLTRERILRLPEVVELCGIKRSTIRRLEMAGRFPRRCHLGLRSVGWKESEVRAWIANLNSPRLADV